jgi:zinc D-Ala-D-Ala dipeptidase
LQDFILAPAGALIQVGLIRTVSAPVVSTRGILTRGILIRTILIGAILALGVARSWGEAALPPGFVRLRDVAPSIRQDIRYAGAFNFTGQIVPGYEGPECITRAPVAASLARAQAKLLAQGFALKVYDCYRPRRAVRAFVDWSQARGADAMKSIFYPGLDKSKLFALGYIAPNSRHTAGIAIDVGLVRAGEDDSLAAPLARGGRCDGPFEERARESSLDLGTAYDCFSDRSATASPDISAAAQANRAVLRRALAAESFHNYSREWWHYEFNAPAEAAKVYDFPVR